MAATELGHVAQDLLSDYDARTPGQRLAQTPEPTLTEAYTLQGEVAQLRACRGEKVIGYKVGCTSPAIRAQLGVAEPIFGRLFASDCFPCGVSLAQTSYANLAVEGEVAVSLARDLPETALPDQDWRDAIAAVFPVIELHHYVLHPKWSPAAWLIASNGLHAGFVLPEEPAACPQRAPAEARLRVEINGVAVGAAPVLSPLPSLRWLASRLAACGLALTRGQIILTGSALPLYPVAAGSTIVVDAPPLGQSHAQIRPWSKGGS